MTRSTPVMREPRRQRVLQHGLGRSDPEREPHEVALMAVLTKLIHEPPGQRLGPPANERDVGVDDRDLHGPPAPRSVAINAAITRSQDPRGGGGSSPTAPPLARAIRWRRPSEAVNVTPASAQAWRSATASE